MNATGRDGNAVTLMANKGVILATGGFAGNVELRPEVLRRREVARPRTLADHLQHARRNRRRHLHGGGRWRGAGGHGPDSAAALLQSADRATFDITSANCFINKNGERFVREDGRRDEMAKAMIAQPEGLVYYIFSCEDPNEVYSLGKQTLQYYLTTISTAT